jgi:cyclase
MGTDRIKGRVYVNTGYDGANVACIDTGRGPVLVDAPMLQKDISDWKAVLESLNSGGPAYIIATHAHFDHIIGNNALGERVVMHAAALQAMLAEGGTLREAMAPLAPGRTKEDIDFILSEPLVHPQITFEEDISLYVGGVALRLFCIGGHTPGSICVHLEDENVLFTGDNITAGLHPYKGDAHFRDWIESLKFMKSLAPDIIVPGHGEVCEADELDRFIEYFSRLWYLTEHMIKKGKDKQEIVKTVHDRMFGYFEVDPERLEGAKAMFDMGTVRLFDEIISCL